MDGDRWAPCLAVFDSRKGNSLQFLAATGGLGASSASLPLFTRTVRERIPVAGYDRLAAVFFKVQREESHIPSLPIPNI